MSSSDQPIQPINPAATRKTQAQNLKAMQNVQAAQIPCKASLSSMTEDIFSTFVMLRNAEPLDKRVKKQEHKHSEAAREDSEDNVVIDDVAKTAEDFQQRNPEMQKRALLSLRAHVKESDSPEEILEKILKSYPDHFLADEALDFLSESSGHSTKLGRNTLIAKNLLNERFGREVRAGRNINFQAQEFSKQGLGNPGALRDLYRDITGNPREPIDLFEELNQEFTFDKMKVVIQFVLHSIGTDLKSKGPSIDKLQLQQLFSNGKVMQAILGVFRFFYQRMRLITTLFKKENIDLPPKLNFELLSKQFVKLLMERYQSPDKILRLASILGISEEILAQIIIFTQYRDAMRGVSPRLFKSDKHRQDLLLSLIETISELDDILEEEEEEDEDEEKNEDDEIK